MIGEEMIKKSLKPDYRKVILATEILTIFVLFLNPKPKYLFDEIGDIIFLIFVFVAFYLLISLASLIYNKFKNKGTVKTDRFFSPTFWKIVLTLIIFILIMNSTIFLDPRPYPILYEMVCDNCPHYTVSIFSFKSLGMAYFISFIFSFMEITLSYVISCIIAQMVRKIKFL